MKRNVVAWAALVVSAAALVSSRGVTRPLPAAQKITAESHKTAHALSEAFSTVAEFAKPSVVQISVERKGGALKLNRGGRRMPGPGGPNGVDPKEFEEMLKRFFGPNLPDGHPEREQFGGGGRGTGGVGSGFVFDDHGHILTNNHVVDGAGKILVTFSDGVEAPAKVVGADPQTDVAVIQVENTGYRPLPRGVSSKLRVGELVMAVGSPFSLSQSVTTGIISATDRTEMHINGVRDSYESFLQTDAAINPGNSGGPLVNMDGQVIGVTSAIVTGSGNHGNDGVGFAIPIDLAYSVAENLIKHGKMRRSRVGIVLDRLTPAMAKQLGMDPKARGILVGEILKGSPAEQSGLKLGDVILGFNGVPVSSLATFRMTVASSDAGHEFGLTYWRDGKEHSTTIKPVPAEQVVFDQEKESEKEAAPEPKKPVVWKTEIADFGLEVQPATAELVAQFGHAKDAKGLLVSEVKEGSPAEAAGLESGQLITHVVKDKRVQTIGTVKEFQAMAGDSDEIALKVQTPKGPAHFVTLSKAKKK